MLDTSASLESWFINALVRAGSSSQCCAIPSKCVTAPSRPLFIGRRQYHGRVHRIQQYSMVTHARSNVEPPQPDTERTRSQEELLRLVDDYHDAFGDGPLPELPQRYQPSDGPHLTVSERVEDEWPDPKAWTMPADPELRELLIRLQHAVKEYDDPEEIYRVYRAFPGQRVPFLSPRLRHKMLSRLASVETKDEHAMLRYFSVLDDMKATAIPLNANEWNSAISFAARYVEKVTDVETEAALHLWREMELVANHKGDHVTFNILFDVACKAGKFVLAEMIYKEMQARGLQFNRYHHVTLIIYHGLRKNGDAVRTAYKGLVQAREIVDSRVLNAMISALLNCEEEEAAENIYARMKQAHLERYSEEHPPRRDWRSQRAIDRALLSMAKIAKAQPGKIVEFQQKSSMSPDIHTYRTLIRHHAEKTGQLEKAIKLIEEMRWLNAPLDERIFSALFRGFCSHGGIRYSPWTEERLERIWAAFLTAVDDNTDAMHLSRKLVVWGLRAFGQCSGKLRTIKAWEEAKHRWNASEEDIDYVLKTGLRPILEGREMLERRNDWILGE